MTGIDLRVGAGSLAACRAAAAGLVADRGIVVTDDPELRVDGARVLLVDPLGPERWLREACDRRTSLLDVGEVDRLLGAVLRSRGAKPASTEPCRADHRAIELEDGPWTLTWATPFDLGVGTSDPVDTERTLQLVDCSSGERWPVTARIVESDGSSGRAVLSSIPPAAQRAIARASRELRTVDTVVRTASAPAPPVGWWEPTDLAPVLDSLVGGRADASVVVDGRAHHTCVVGRNDRILLLDDIELDGERVCHLATAGGRVSLVGSGWLERSGAHSRVVLDRAFLPDRRRAPRIAIDVEVPAGAGAQRLRDICSGGVGLVSPSGGSISLHLGDAEVTVELRPAGPDRSSGGRLVTDAPTFRGRRVELGDASFDRTVRSAVEVRSSLVQIGEGRARVAGLWSEVGDPAGTPLLVVVPPTWARTKETASLLAEFLAANFLTSDRRVAILRIDYRNTRGESWVDPAHRRPNEEALGFRFTDALDDVRAAVTFGLDRLGTTATVVLVGMSFSGPICLRAAANDPRVDALAQVMAGSDLQNLIRMATGGIDVFAEHRSGLGREPLNVLGVLMDPAVSIADASALDLACVSHSQDDAARLDRPLLWITGESDGFVDPELVAGVVAAAAGDATKVTVPCGHVPSSSAEVVTAYAPLVAWLRALLSDRDGPLVIPDESVALEIVAEEFGRLPRTPMPSPADYWRAYMLGEEGVLSYEILAATAEFRDLMGQQVARLRVEPGCRVVDIGAGLGHLLRHLPEVEPPGLDLHAMDLVPELLAALVSRVPPVGVRVHTEVFDAASDPIPAAVADADAVLLSLFLSVLPDPAGFLARLVRRLRPGTRVVASSAQPDADLSMAYIALVDELVAGRVAPPQGWTVPEFVTSIRHYQNAAADLFRRAEEGQIRLYTGTELAALLAAGGLVVEEVLAAGGTLAAVVSATVPEAGPGLG